ncbi:hypothetical protein [Hymenobacter sp. B81]|uniref:hypothetical protein n=1 Tax=Hymenobacter sp. B81 TaxID=3344878 RepID=UPI0037DC9E6E
MYRPDSLKLRIDYTATWTRLKRLFKNPEPIRPAAVPAHLAALEAPRPKFKLPRLKGNVVHTMKEIINIFLADWRRSTRAINLAIRTTRTSLAKRCDNADPKTAYRHILALIEHGFLRGKAQVRGGLQLLINPALIVFDEPCVAMASQSAPAPRVAPAAPQRPAKAPVNGMASLLALAAQFSQATARPS